MSGNIRAALAWGLLSFLVGTGQAAGDHGTKCNPIMAVEDADGTTEHGATLEARCVELMMRLGATADTDVTGTLVIRNGCQHAVAVLVEPIEVIVRRPEDSIEQVVDEATNGAARLVLTAAGTRHAAKQVDLYLRVRGAVGYVVVPARGARNIPVRGHITSDSLLPGTYRSVLLTKAAYATCGTDSTADAIDLSRSVAAHNASLAGEPFLAPRASAALIRTNTGTVVVAR